ncbi:hypothetical protein HJG60_011686 [Phyllostomus discolor]|uniref:Uncharacterized protein n=1 Tax=Phyllostomus discolor TaxID=89673 RepID=A0A834DXK5_9CHIR|nr:hypothetical protein HJG60_011686 [Phyllostomus discolor]
MQPFLPSWPPGAVGPQAGSLFPLDLSTLLGGETAYFLFSLETLLVGAPGHLPRGTIVGRVWPSEHSLIITQSEYRAKSEWEGEGGPIGTHTSLPALSRDKPGSFPGLSGPVSPHIKGGGAHAPRQVGRLTRHIWASINTGQGVTARLSPRTLGLQTQPGD